MSKNECYYMAEILDQLLQTGQPKSQQVVTIPWGKFMTSSTHDPLSIAESLLKQKDSKSRFTARQLLFLNSPLSKLVELYLYNNEGAPQNLTKFPMMVPIYDCIPKKLLLKCSRKTLKSTLISNIYGPT